MEYIVDVQGFRRSSNLFVVKELAILKLSENSIPSVYHFQPPCKWKKLLDEEKKVNGWLTKKYHGMVWESGMFPYRWVIGVLQSNLKNATTIYVKGLQKKRWIEEMLPGKLVNNIEDFGCPTLKNIHKDDKIRCPYHPHCSKPNCAVKNVDSLRWWLLKNVYTYDESPNVSWEDKDVCWRDNELNSRIVPFPRIESTKELTTEILHSMYT